MGHHQTSHDQTPQGLIRFCLSKHVPGCQQFIGLAIAANQVDPCSTTARVRIHSSTGPLDNIRGTLRVLCKKGFGTQGARAAVERSVEDCKALLRQARQATTQSDTEQGLLAAEQLLALIRTQLEELLGTAPVRRPAIETVSVEARSERRSPLRSRLRLGQGSRRSITTTSSR